MSCLLKPPSASQSLRRLGQQLVLHVVSFLPPPENNMKIENENTGAGVGGILQFARVQCAWGGGYYACTLLSSAMLGCCRRLLPSQQLMSRR